MVMRNNADCAVSGCSAARMPVFRPAAPEYIIYIFYLSSLWSSIYNISGGYLFIRATHERDLQMQTCTHL